MNLWIEIHPLNDNEHYPLWISQATNYNNQPLGFRGFQIIEVFISSQLEKHKRLYLLPSLTWHPSMQIF
jgi:hypothetical protein